MWMTQSEIACKSSSRWVFKQSDKASFMCLGVTWDILLHNHLLSWTIKNLVYNFAEGLYINPVSGTCMGCKSLNLNISCHACTYMQRWSVYTRPLSQLLLWTSPLPAVRSSHHMSWIVFILGDWEVHSTGKYQKISYLQGNSQESTRGL